MHTPWLSYTSTAITLFIRHTHLAEKTLTALWNSWSCVLRMVNMYILPKQVEKISNSVYFGCACTLCNPGQIYIHKFTAWLSKMCPWHLEDVPTKLKPDGALHISTDTTLLKYLLHWLGCPTCGREILSSFWTFSQLCTLAEWIAQRGKLSAPWLVSVSARLAAAGIIACEAGNERPIFRVWDEFQKKMKEYKLKAINLFYV